MWLYQKRVCSVCNMLLLLMAAAYFFIVVTRSHVVQMTQLRGSDMFSLRRPFMPLFCVKTLFIYLNTSTSIYLFMNEKSIPWTVSCIHGQHSILIWKYLFVTAGICWSYNISLHSFLCTVSTDGNLFFPILLCPSEQQRSLCFFYLSSCSLLQPAWRSGWSSGTFISNDYLETLFVRPVFKQSVCQPLFVRKLLLKLLNALFLRRNPPFCQQESASWQQPMEQKVKHIYRYRYHSPVSRTASSGSDIKSRNHTPSNTRRLCLA